MLTHLTHTPSSSSAPKASSAEAKGDSLRNPHSPRPKVIPVPHSPRPKVLVPLSPVGQPAPLPKRHTSSPSEPVMASPSHAASPKQVMNMWLLQSPRSLPTSHSLYQTSNTGSILRNSREAQSWERECHRTASHLQEHVCQLDRASLRIGL